MSDIYVYNNNVKPQKIFCDFPRSFDDQITKRTRIIFYKCIENFQYIINNVQTNITSIRFSNYKRFPDDITDLICQYIDDTKIPMFEYIKSDSKHIGKLLESIGKNNNIKYVRFTDSPIMDCQTVNKLFSIKLRYMNICLHGKIKLENCILGMKNLMHNGELKEFIIESPNKTHIDFIIEICKYNKSIKYLSINTTDDGELINSNLYDMLNYNRSLTNIKLYIDDKSYELWQDIYEKLAYNDLLPEMVDEIVKEKAIRFIKYLAKSKIRIPGFIINEFIDFYKSLPIDIYEKIY